METNFNFKSQICTTREQSERLLSLSLKKETADMHHYQYIEGGKWNIEARPSIAGYNNRLVPAWSLHRLIEMYLNSSYYIIESIEFETDDEEDAYTKTIRQIEWLIKEGYFNKEYLEEL